ncbi:MAG: DUF1376 domain-containing protein [Saprospiraceae bacterium]|nr:DUF1376 domain-containing protein [Candidatus Vicinibacter affinis]
MAKDPAVLIYFDKWISSTNGIKAEFRAWYLDLLIYQYDKGGLPNDEDTLAGICRVLPSEYAKFTQMRTQIIAQKFTQSEDGMLRNDIMNDILRKREAFKEKKSRAGYIGNIVKELNKSETFTTVEVSTIKDKLRVCIDEEFEEILSIYRLKDITHLRTHLRTLYIDVDEDVIKNVIEIKKGGLGEKTKKTKSNFQPPTILEFKKYFEENGFDLAVAERAWKGYDAAEWHDSQGNKVKNWKQKCQNVWFKPENKTSGPPKINAQLDLSNKIVGGDKAELARQAAIRINQTKQEKAEAI